MTEIEKEIIVILIRGFKQIIALLKGLQTKDRLKNIKA